MTIHRGKSQWSARFIVIMSLGAMSGCTEAASGTAMTTAPGPPLPSPAAAQAAAPSVATPTVQSSAAGVPNSGIAGASARGSSAPPPPSNVGAAGTSAQSDRGIARSDAEGAAGADATKPATPAAPGGDGPPETFEGIEWVSTADNGIGYDKAFQMGTKFLTPMNSEDYKPAYSPDLSQITFFRVFDYGNGPFDSWSTKVAVMNADGSNIRMLTGLSAHHVPKWTQDGSNKIVFSRNEDGGGKVWWTVPNGSPGDEQLLSNFSAPTTKEENFSALPDGRILVHRRNLAVDPTRNSMMAMTPLPGGKSTYEPIVYAPAGSPVDASNICFSKLTVSPSGTKVAYMKMVGDGDYITQSQIAYADWDVGALTVSNEVIIAQPMPGKQTWYPTFTPKEQFIVYAQDGKVYAYEIASKVTKRISAADHFYRYPSSARVSK